MTNKFGWVLLSAAVLGLGSCQDSKEAPPSEGTENPEEPKTEAGSALSFVSHPARYALAGEAFHYKPALSLPGAPSWELVSGPADATFTGGQLSWNNPTAGTTRFELRATLEGVVAEQGFNLEVAGKSLQASTEVDPENPLGAKLSVDAPLSPIRGTAVNIEPGALASGSAITLSIAAVQNPPVPPSVAGKGVSGADLRVVEFGPTGTTFQKPVTVYLPVSDAVLAAGTPEVRTYDYATGSWTSVPVLSVDAANKVVVAEVQHFSSYAALPPAPVVVIEANSGGASCGEVLFVRTRVAQTFAQLPATAVNGSAGSASTLAELLSQLPVGSALQVFTRLRVRPLNGTQERLAGWLASAARLESGHFKVQVSTDSQSGEGFAIPAEVELAAVEEWLNGTRVNNVVGNLGKPWSEGARVDAELFLSVVPASAAQQLPLVPTNPLGSDAFSASTIAPLEGFDQDCDGIPDAHDSTPQGEVPPVLVASPAGVVQTKLGAQPVTLSVAASPAEVTFAWASSSPGLGLQPSGASAVLVPTLPGSFKVTVTATRGSAQSSYSWSVRVDSADAPNTAPRVYIAASSPSLNVGETIRLVAVAHDAEQPVTALGFKWSTSGGTLSSSTEGEVTFQASASGDYVVRCAVSDGAAESVAEIKLSALAAQTNRPPSAPVVTPLSAILERTPGTSVSVTITMSAKDPDGDAVAYQISAAPETTGVHSLVKSGATATFSTSENGLYLFYVSAVDAQGAESLWVPLKIRVLDPISATPVDADNDQFPASEDCDDNDPTRYPGAPEICGDSIDQNCDGQDRPVQFCDADGDRFSPNQGDCDDNDPKRFPGALEWCDGVDNDCDSQVDEDYGVNTSCAAGVGACSATGARVCNAARNGAVCDAVPSAPAAEVCGDGVDNDCNGWVDDAVGGNANDVKNCGGCQRECPPAPNAAPLCVQGGCQLACVQGFVDVNSLASDGCECELSNGGVEICDGKDNDCDGLVDENTGHLFYGGPQGTEGTGLCASGIKACINGQLVVTRMEVTPSPEQCNGVDDDCDGQSDEDFSLQSDVKNCGACNRACMAGQSCISGACTGGSDAGVPPAGDAGDEGKPCTADSMCQSTNPAGICFPAVTADGKPSPWTDGYCSAPCGQSPCSPSGMCVTFPHDQQNYCVARCPQPKSGQSTCRTGYVCVGVGPTNDGICIPSCQTPGMGCDPGETCMSDGYCSGGDGGQGDGGYACYPPRTPCPDGCVDTQFDSKNCGACGVACSSSEYCDMGQCVPGTPPPPPDGGYYPPPPDGGYSCNPPLTPCPGGCEDTQFDSKNCGACGVACSSSEYCDMGQCVPGTPPPPPDGGYYPPPPPPGDGGSSCNPPLTPCPNGCFDLQFDAKNCGACGVACSAGEYCEQGQCMQGPPPPPPPTDGGP